MQGGRSGERVAAILAGALALAPPSALRAQSASSDPPPVYARTLGACAAQPDPGACVLIALRSVRPWAEDAEALAPLQIVQHGWFGVREGFDDLADYRRVLDAWRGGAAPAAALAVIDARPNALKARVFTRICLDVDTVASAAPSHDLGAAAADRLEAGLGAVTGGERIGATIRLATCRARLGDLPGVDRVLALGAGAGAAAPRWAFLAMAGRFDLALDAAPSPKETARSGPASGSIHSNAFVASQRAFALRQVLVEAAAAGQDAVADRAADLILTGAMAGDADSAAYAEGALAKALPRVCARRPRTQAVQTVKRAAAMIQPGMPAWSASGAVAVRRALTTLGLSDEARTYYDTTAASAAGPPPANGATASDTAWQSRMAMATMLSDDGHWDVAEALGGGWLSGGGPDLDPATMGAWLDTLGSHPPGRPDPRALLLIRCVGAAAGDPLGRGLAVAPDLPVDLGLRCARLLEQGGSTAIDDPLLSGAIANSRQILTLALAAGKAGRLQAATSLVAMVLNSWTSPQAAEVTLSDDTIAVLIAAASLGSDRRAEAPRG